MQFTQSRFTLADFTITRIDFAPHTFTPGDLAVLPHAAQLARAVATRQAEHLAGRLAARAALMHAGADDTIPAIGSHREPLWPAGFTGSISHSAHTALAVAHRKHDALEGIGLDGEAWLDEAIAREIAAEAINRTESARLQASGLPFSRAMTQIFSAKESLFKALFPQVGDWFGFDAAQVVALTAHQLTLELTQQVGPFAAGHRFHVAARADDAGVMTLTCCPKG